MFNPLVSRAATAPLDIERSSRLVFSFHFSLEILDIAFIELTFCHKPPSTGNLCQTPWSDVATIARFELAIAGHRATLQSSPPLYQFSNYRALPS